MAPDNAGVSGCIKVLSRACPTGEKEKPATLRPPASRNSEETIFTRR